MSLTRLLVYKLHAKSTVAKYPSNEAIVHYFAKFGIIRSLIFSNSIEGLVEFETVDAVNTIMSSGQHSINEYEVVINSIPVNISSRTEQEFQYLRYEVCEVNPPNDEFLDLKPELKKARLKLFSKPHRIGLLGFNINKEAQVAAKVKIPEHQGWSVKLSVVDEKEYSTFTDIFKITLGHKMQYVQYEMLRNEEAEEIALSELLWKFFQKEDVVYVHPHTSSLCGIIVLPTKETAEQYRAKSGSKVGGWKIDLHHAESALIRVTPETEKRVEISCAEADTQHSQTKDWTIMSISRLIVYKMTSESPNAKIPSKEAIADYFKVFGEIKRIISTNTSQGLIEFETTESVRKVMLQPKHEIKDFTIGIESIPVHSRFKSPKFAELFNTTLGDYMRYVKYKISKVETADGQKDILWTFLREEDVIYIYPNSCSPYGTIVVANERIAEKFKSMSGSVKKGWRIDLLLINPVTVGDPPETKTSQSQTPEKPSPEKSVKRNDDPRGMNRLKLTQSRSSRSETDAKRIENVESPPDEMSSKSRDKFVPKLASDRVEKNVLHPERSEQQFGKSSLEESGIAEEHMEQQNDSEHLEHEKRLDEEIENVGENLHHHEDYEQQQMDRSSDEAAITTLRMFGQINRKNAIIELYEKMETEDIPEGIEGDETQQSENAFSEDIESAEEHMEQQNDGEHLEHEKRLEEEIENVGENLQYHEDYEQQQLDRSSDEAAITTLRMFGQINRKNAIIELYEKMETEDIPEGIEGDETQQSENAFSEDIERYAYRHLDNSNEIHQVESFSDGQANNDENYQDIENITSPLSFPSSKPSSQVSDKEIEMEDNPVRVRFTFLDTIIPDILAIERHFRQFGDIISVYLHNLLAEGNVVFRWRHDAIKAIANSLRVIDNCRFDFFSKISDEEIVKSYAVGFQFPGKIVFNIEAIAKNFERFGQLQRIVQNPWTGKGFAVFSQIQSSLLAHLEPYHAAEDSQMGIFQLRDGDIENDIFSVDLSTDSELGQLMRRYKMYRVDFRVSGSVPEFTAICEWLCRRSTPYQLEIAYDLMKGSVKFWNFASAEAFKSKTFEIGDAIFQCGGGIYTETGHVEDASKDDNAVSLTNSVAIAKPIESLGPPSIKTRPSGYRYRLVRITPIFNPEPEMMLTVKLNLTDDIAEDAGPEETKSSPSPTSSDFSPSKDDTISSAMKFLNSLPRKSSVEIDDSSTSNALRSSLSNGCGGSKDVSQQNSDSETSQPILESSVPCPRPKGQRRVTFSDEISYRSMTSSSSNSSEVEPNSSECEKLSQAAVKQPGTDLEDTESDQQDVSCDLTSISPSKELQKPASPSEGNEAGEEIAWTNEWKCIFLRMTNLNEVVEFPTEVEIRTYFEQYGTVTDILVQAVAGEIYVMFSRGSEAKSALSSKTHCLKGCNFRSHPTRKFPCEIKEPSTAVSETESSLKPSQSSLSQSPSIQSPQQSQNGATVTQTTSDSSFSRRMLISPLRPLYTLRSTQVIYDHFQQFAKSIHVTRSAKPPKVEAKGITMKAGDLEEFDPEKCIKVFIPRCTTLSMPKLAKSLARFGRVKFAKQPLESPILFVAHIEPEEQMNDDEAKDERYWLSNFDSLLQHTEDCLNLEMAYMHVQIDTRNLHDESDWSPLQLNINRALRLCSLSLFNDPPLFMNENNIF
ncbi:unnamed protein product [Rodentolepis nana]|uniref:RRM domain-containing protein n=1 Tax=Rodentolepis nana TaxID=102285 RepID=A0A158QHL9_RODNA|nr:unnamed protein product [Rodentolepis nana]